MIYFVRAGADGLVKIGWTKHTNPKVRIGSFEPVMPVELDVIRLLDAPRWAEYWLHKVFGDYRVTGEWFTFHPDMLTIEPPAEKPWQSHSPIFSQYTRLLVLLPEEMLERIDAYRREQTILTARAEAIRRLIRAGLDDYLDKTPAAREAV